MKTVICYASRHHGNTRRVVEAMAREGEAELIDALSKKDLKEVQVVDSTGFWEHRDFQRLSQETYVPWLEQELRGALGKLEQSSESVPLFWGEEDYLPHLGR